MRFLKVYEMVTLNLLAFLGKQDYYLNAELATILFGAHEFKEGCSCELRVQLILIPYVLFPYSVISAPDTAPPLKH